MLGAVGAYDWNGTVVMVKDSDISIPSNDTFRDRHSEKIEPLAAYLGKKISPYCNIFNKHSCKSHLQIFSNFLHSESLGNFIIYKHVCYVIFFVVVL